MATSNGRSFAYVPCRHPGSHCGARTDHCLPRGEAITPSEFCQEIPLTVADLGDLFGFDAATLFLDRHGQHEHSCAPTGGAPDAGAGVTLGQLDPTMENETLMALLDSDPAKSLFDAGLQNALRRIRVDHRRHTQRALALLSEHRDRGR